jgi:hypothetical protein
MKMFMGMVLISAEEYNMKMMKAALDFCIDGYKMGYSDCKENKEFNLSTVTSEFHNALVSAKWKADGGKFTNG